jgi:hypothetical protein
MSAAEETPVVMSVAVETPPQSTPATWEVPPVRQELAASTLPPPTLPPPTALEEDKLTQAVGTDLDENLDDLLGRVLSGQGRPKRAATKALGAGAPQREPTCAPTPGLVQPPTSTTMDQDAGLVPIFLHARWKEGDGFALSELIETLRLKEGMDVYDFTTPAHCNSTLAKKSAMIFAHIRKCAAFVFWSSEPAEVSRTQSAGVLQLGLALGLNKPVIFIDPHMDHHNLDGTGVGGVEGYHMIISNPHGIGALDTNGNMSVVSSWDEALKLLKCVVASHKERVAAVGPKSVG